MLVKLTADQQRLLDNPPEFTAEQVDFIRAHGIVAIRNLDRAGIQPDDTLALLARYRTISDLVSRIEAHQADRRI